MGMAVLFALVLFILYARSDVTRSRSTFYAIAACAVSGMLLFQAALNVFGPTDVLPLTGRHAAVHQRRRLQYDLCLGASGIPQSVR